MFRSYETEIFSDIYNFSSVVFLCTTCINIKDVLVLPTGYIFVIHMTLRINKDDFLSLVALTDWSARRCVSLLGRGLNLNIPFLNDRRVTIKVTSLICNWVKLYKHYCAYLLSRLSYRSVLWLRGLHLVMHCIV
jgi:hypothetical protein